MTESPFPQAARLVWTALFRSSGRQNVAAGSPLPNRAAMPPWGPGAWRAVPGGNKRLALPAPKESRRRRRWADRRVHDTAGYESGQADRAAIVEPEVPIASLIARPECARATQHDGDRARQGGQYLHEFGNGLRQGSHVAGLHDYCAHSPKYPAADLTALFFDLIFSPSPFDRMAIFQSRRHWLCRSGSMPVLPTFCSDVKIVPPPVLL
jgi:hypothetical protein